MPNAANKYFAPWTTPANIRFCRYAIPDVAVPFAYLKWMAATRGHDRRYVNNIKAGLRRRLAGSCQREFRRRQTSGRQRRAPANRLVLKRTRSRVLRMALRSLRFVPVASCTLRAMYDHRYVARRQRKNVLGIIPETCDTAFPWAQLLRRAKNPTSDWRRESRIPKLF